MSTKQYFEKFANRLPYQSRRKRELENLVFQFLGICTVVSGIFYLNERWLHSINSNALWFSLPLIIAENLSMIGTILFVISLWENKTIKQSSPVKLKNQINKQNINSTASVSIDIFITTYNESSEVLKYTVKDCKNLCYQHPEVNLKIFLLDDGKRDGTDKKKDNLKTFCRNENIIYLGRENNKGFKAGNLRNGIEQSKGDILVILDADTRVFPNFLNHTTGYFKNERVAWVQTPQWFYDIPIHRSNKIKTTNIFKRIQFWITQNEDPLGNDTQGFYDVILKRRNYYNAAFCCGAGSLHRRSALMETAVKEFTSKIKKKLKKSKNQEDNENRIAEIISETTISPFEFHASEDLCTSLLMHADKERRWQSVQHPHVECQMLSTQNLKDKIKQHQRYAEGTLDIALRMNPLFKKGLTIGQKLCYASTIWSYLSPIWITIFILSPVIYFFTLESPVNTNAQNLINYFVVFQIFNTITFNIAFWGINTTRSEQFYISGFWYLLKSIIKIIVRNKIQFHVTPKTKTKSNNVKYIIPHLSIIAIGFIGVIYNIYLLNYNIHPDPKAFCINTIWFVYTLWSFSAIIKAAFLNE